MSFNMKRMEICGNIVLYIRIRKILKRLLKGAYNVEISQNKLEFINTMITFKVDLERCLDSNISGGEIEAIREEYQGKYSKERFKEYLVKKTALHITFKYIRIRMASESQNLINPKFNEEGIRNWSELSKNYRKDYYLLFNLACKDMQRQEQIGNLFDPCIYDNYIEKTKNIFSNRKQENHIEKLKIYNFKTFNPNIAISLFDLLYPIEDREKIEGFLEESKVVTELMTSLGLL